MHKFEIYQVGFQIEMNFKEKFVKLSNLDEIRD